MLDFLKFSFITLGILLYPQFKPRKYFQTFIHDKTVQMQFNKRLVYQVNTVHTSNFESTHTHTQ